MRTDRSTSRTPAFVQTLIALLALIGMADALYLTVLHLTGQSAACGDGADCSAVLASPYSHFGPVPVAGIGLLGYFAIFACATFAAFGHTGPRRLLAPIVGLMFLGTLWFLYAQAFLLHQYCRFCLGSAAIIFLLAALIIATMPGKSHPDR